MSYIYTELQLGSNEWVFNVLPWPASKEILIPQSATKETPQVVFICYKGHFLPKLQAECHL